MSLVCSQKASRDGVIKIGTIGDSITAGVHSTGGNHTYPGQLQLMLDAKYPGKVFCPPHCADTDFMSSCSVLGHQPRGVWQHHAQER